MNPRIALAVLAVTCTLAALTENLEARPLKVGRAPATFDVAAAPAYPTAEMPGRAGRRAGSPAVKASRTGDRGVREANASPVASLSVFGTGIIRSAKTGATAKVAPRYAARFQAYIDDLEARGAAVYYMGGIRRGRCSPASQHPCGKALDVCQDWRGHVSGARDCRLPRPAEMAAIAERHGLHEGAVWCGSPDYGHAQVDKTGTNCVARGTFGPRRHRIASRSGGRL